MKRQYPNVLYRIGDVKDKGSILRTMYEFKPHIIVNTAAMTDGVGNLPEVLNLAGTGGRGAIIEYNVKDETTDFTQIGTLTAYFKDSSDYGVSDEFIGADIVDFQLDNSGILQYKSTASKKMHYYTRTIGVE